MRIMGAQSGLLFLGSALTDDAASGAIQGQVNLAVQQGKKVLIRADGQSNVQMALATGCHGLVRGASMGRENLERLAESGVVWLPTVYAMQVETPYGKRTITTETTARDELFLRELGITIVR